MERRLEVLSQESQVSEPDCLGHSCVTLALSCVGVIQGQCGSILKRSAADE